MRENDEIIIERSKSRQAGSKVPKIIGICVLLLIAVMVISAVVSEISGVSVASVGDTSDKGTIIYDSLPDSIKDIEKYSSGVVMLTDTAVEYLDYSGKRYATNSHLYSQPVMVHGKSSVLLYDKGGTSFRIERNSKIYNTHPVQSPISVAAIGKKGDYAYVLNEDGGYQSHLFVYSYKGKKLFEWGSAADYCISAALSDNGRYIALSMLGVKNGEYVSTVVFFDFRNSEAVYTSQFPDCTVFRIEFLSGKNIAVFADNGVYVIDKAGNVETKAEYTPSEITHTVICDKGLSATALALHGNNKDSVLNVFDKRMNSIFSINYNSEIMKVRTSDDYVSVILGDRIETFNSKGEKTGTITIDEKCFDAAFSGRTLFVLTVSGIYSFDVQGEYDLTAIKEEVSSDIIINSDEDETTDVFSEEIASEETTSDEAASGENASDENNSFVAEEITTEETPVVSYG